MAQTPIRMPGGSQSHANSGPTSHSNVPGHANFTKTFADPSIRMSPSIIEQIERGLAGGATGASHANSGPTTHSNVPGHANFTKQLSDRAARIDERQLGVLQSGINKVLTGGAAASHANSGPTTHSNVPGHANFSKTFGDKTTRLDPAQVTQFERSLGAGLSRGASHANSGPTTHSNVPGHANFTKTFGDRSTRLDPAQIEAIQKNIGGG